MSSWVRFGVKVRFRISKFFTFKSSRSQDELPRPTPAPVESYALGFGEFESRAELVQPSVMHCCSKAIIGDRHACA